MEKSLLQKERAGYQPKPPTGLQGAVRVKEGEPTQSVGDQQEIKKLFPNTYGMPLIEFVPGEENLNCEMNVGVILSGGQAPGGPGQHFHLLQRRLRRGGDQQGAVFHQRLLSGLYLYEQGYGRGL